MENEDLIPNRFVDARALDAMKEDRVEHKQRKLEAVGNKMKGHRLTHREVQFLVVM